MCGTLDRAGERRRWDEAGAGDANRGRAFERLCCTGESARFCPQQRVHLSAALVLCRGAEGPLAVDARMEGLAASACGASDERRSGKRKWSEAGPTSSSLRYRGTRARRAPSPSPRPPAHTGARSTCTHTHPRTLASRRETSGDRARPPKKARASTLAPSALPPPSPTLLPSPDEADAITAAAVSAMGDLDITTAVVPLDGERDGERDKPALSN